MKKLLFAIFSIAVLVSAFAMTAMANDGSVPRYTTAQTVLYADPNASSTALEVVPAGSKINAWVDVQQNGFTNAMTQNNSGWIATAFLSKANPVGPTPTPTPTPAPTPAPTPSPVIGGNGGGSLKSMDGAWNCTKQLAQRASVYSQPTTAITPSWTMEAGTNVYVTNVTNGWAQITSPYTGYIPSCYIDGWNVPTNYPAGSTTWYIGYDWSAVYNYEYYKANNPDVVAALGTSPDKLIAHFVEHGIYEGRRGSATFDVYTFKANNSYLKSRCGNNLSCYYKEACGIPH